MNADPVNASWTRVVAGSGVSAASWRHVAFQARLEATSWRHVAVGIESEGVW